MISCSPDNKAKLIGECQLADAIILTYACDRPATLDRLSTYWLPELRRLEVFIDFFLKFFILIFLLIAVDGTFGLLLMVFCLMCR